MSRRGLAGLAAVVCALALGVPAQAQDVELGEFAWLAGTWQGPGPGGAMAEIHFMAPEAGVLPSIFRLRQDGRVVVLEAISLTREEDGLFMYVRHFDPALVPMEKEHAIKLRLTRREGDAFFFENVHEGENPTKSVMTRTDEGFESWSELARPDGSADTIRVEYRPVDGGAASTGEVGATYSEARLEQGVLEWSVVVEAPVSRVWEAFTREEAIEAWMVPDAEIALEVGGLLRTNYDADAGVGGPGTIESRILAFEPRRMLAMKAVTVPENAPQAEPIRDAWSVTYFEPLGPGRTRLTLKSLGWGEGPAWDRAREFFREGNLWHLRNLKAHLENG